MRMFKDDKKEIERLIKKVDELENKLYQVKSELYISNELINKLKLIYRTWDIKVIESHESDSEKRSELKSKGYEFLGTLYDGLEELWLKK